MVRINLSLLFAFAVSTTFANSITWPGPTIFVVGDPKEFKLFSTTLTVPGGGDTGYSIKLETNYGDPLQITLPGSPDVIPPFPFENEMYAMSDFLIDWNGAKYGVVFSSHDGYAIGLYELCALCEFEQSLAVMGGKSPRPFFDVYISPNGTSSLIGSSTSLTAVQTGDAVSSARYTIVQKFNAPAGFLLSGPLAIQMSSYVCANGYISGTGSLDAAGGNPEVPEPATFLLVAPVLGWLGLLRHRRFVRDAKRSDR